MELGLSTSQKLSQKALVTIGLMQYSNAEMVEYINDVLASNPLVEPEEGTEDEAHFRQLRDRFEWIEQSDEQNKAYYSLDRESDEFGHLSNLSEKGETLSDALAEQLSAMSLSQKERVICEYIIGSLNDDGYFDIPLDTASADLGTTKNEVERSLALIKAMEPEGVGAKDLSECLTIQLRKKRMQDGLAYSIVQEDLQALSRRDYGKIAGKYAVKKEQVLKAAEIIRSLNPRPSMGFAPASKTSYIIPDVLIHQRSDGSFETILNDSHIPNLKVNKEYVRLLSSDNNDTKKYVDQKLNQALWTIKNINIRRKNIYLAAEAIVRRQRSFFENGPGFLEPMILSDVAKEIGVHESTVSRILKSKYAQCKFGIFPFSYFFTSKINRTTGELFESAERIQVRIAEIIQKENKEKPYSDQRITELLNAQGIDIKRRTVAKYRERLGIDATGARKQIRQ